MSLTRHLFREVAPLFRMLEQPFGRTPGVYIGGHQGWNRFDPFREIEVRPAIDVAEQADKYVLDAEIPGVNKENIDIRVSDGGRSITIEGKTTEKSPSQLSTATDAQAESSIVNNVSNSSPSQEQSNQPVTEHHFTRNLQFTRTIWLPRAVDTNEISAKLENGVLTITAKKAEDKAATSIPVQ